LSAEGAPFRSTAGAPFRSTARNPAAINLGSSLLERRSKRGQPTTDLRELLAYHANLKSPGISATSGTATSPCSISRSIASCAAATLCGSGSTTYAKEGMFATALLLFSW
jgi:hypothetical protein